MREKSAGAFGNFLEANYTNDEARLTALASSFWNALNICPAFSWVGMVQVADELDRECYALYIEQVPGLRSNPALYNRSADIDEPFADWACAVRDKALVDIYFCEPMDPAKRVKECIEDAKERYHADSAKMLGHTTLPEPQP